MWLEWKTMISAFLILMVTIAQVKISLPCPSSCVVCSEDVIICHKLLNIIDAPGTTKALMLTDGLIDSVDNMVFSDLSNMSVLALSNNAISTIKENAFWNLTFLTALSLDHNHISSQSLDNSTFSWLHRLETLRLGSNALRDIDGSWFQNSRALKTLQLEGNLLTSLNSSTFALSNLRNLEMLDLSDNLIMYLDRDSFRGLPHLHSLDLSRNLLKNAPDAFSYLSGLSMLNLDLNHWSCTCELRELASFLNSYILAPDKVLNNGQSLVCVNTDNPAVRTMLELTKANCVPPNKNITVEVVAKSNITPQQYIRNVAIAIVLSFLGGVGITLGIIAITYHKLSRKCKQVQEGNGAVERKTSSPETAQWNFCEDKDTQSMSHALYNYNYKSHQPWDRENSPSHITPLDTVANHFTCHKCISTALAVGKQKREIVLQRANLMCEQHERDDDWPTYVACRQHKGNQHSVLQQKIKDTSIRRHDERGAGISNHHHLGSQCTSSQHCEDSNGNSAVKIQQLALRNHFSALQRGPFRPPDQMHKELVTHGNHINQSLLKHQAKDVGTQPIYRTISCLHCHQTDEYRQAGSNNQSFPFLNHSENTIQNGAKMYDAMLYRDFLGYNKSSSGEHGKKQAIDLGFKLASQRNVTFDLDGSEERILTTQADRHKGESRIKNSKTSVQKSNQKLAKMKSSTQGHLKNHKTKAQAKRTLKVKLNLNPLRKNRVHPKSGDQKKNEEGNMSKKAMNEKLRRKKDQQSLKHKSKKEKTSKKLKDNSKGSENEDKDKEADTVDQETSTSKAKKENASSNKVKHSEKENKDSKDTNEVTQESSNSGGSTESGQGPDNIIPVEGKTLQTDGLEDSIFSSCSEAQMLLSSIPPTLPLTLNLNSETTTQQDLDEQSSGLDLMSSGAPVIQEYVSSAEGSPKRKIRLILPEKYSNRPQTALDKKIR